MTDHQLANVGVLVTRSKHQASELAEAIENHGGTVIHYPVLEILPREDHAIANDASGLRDPDIAIFVSPNAVHHGLAYAGEARIATVGPATAAAIESAGRRVDIRPSAGYDSEHLLAEHELQHVDKCCVRIIRGNGGRELIAETLRNRGATVEYLPVYSRRAPHCSTAEQDDLEQKWRAGEVDVVTVMSVESLRNLVSILPEWCRSKLRDTPLVTPAVRVIQEAIEQFPGIPTTLARGPQAGEMVGAIIACSKAQTG